MYDNIKVASPVHHKDRELPKVFWKFFPRNDVQLVLNPQYHHLVCPECGKYDADEIFEVGFLDPVLIRIEGEFGYTNDRMFVINDRMKLLLEKERVVGFESKAIGNSGWNAVRINHYVNHDKTVIESEKEECKRCGRAMGSFGLFEYMSQISVPENRLTFFTTRGKWPTAGSDRSEFITEGVVEVLVSAGVWGGSCVKLFDAKEEVQCKEKAAAGNLSWRPKEWATHLDKKKS